MTKAGLLLGCLAWRTESQNEFFAAYEFDLDHAGRILFGGNVIEPAGNVVHQDFV